MPPTRPAQIPAPAPTLLSESTKEPPTAVVISAVLFFCGLFLFGNKPNRLCLFVLACVLVVTSALIVLCYLFLLPLIHHLRRRQTDQAPQDIETSGVPPQPDDLIDLSKYYEMSSSQMDGDCSICLGEFEEGHEVAELHKCKHIFHRECIDRWLPRLCPLCRADPAEVL